VNRERSETLKIALEEERVTAGGGRLEDASAYKRAPGCSIGLGERLSLTINASLRSTVSAVLFCFFQIVQVHDRISISDNLEMSGRMCLLLQYASRTHPTPPPPPTTPHRSLRVVYHCHRLAPPSTIYSGNSDIPRALQFTVAHNDRRLAQKHTRMNEPLTFCIFVPIQARLGRRTGPSLEPLRKSKRPMAIEGR
jgi:hypothetical protein